MLGVGLSMIETDTMKERFEMMYNSYKDIAFKIAFEILHDHQLAEDALMDSFFVLAEDMDKISDKTLIQARNFLFVIVRNRALKIYNERKKVSYMEETDDAADIQDIELEIENRELQNRLFELIKNMDYKYSDVLILKYLYGFKNTEIAKALGISKNSADQRISRAKSIIKEMIRKGGLYERRSV